MDTGQERRGKGSERIGVGALWIPPGELRRDRPDYGYRLGVEGDRPDYGYRLGIEGDRPDYEYREAWSDRYKIKVGIAMVYIGLLLLYTI